MTTSFSGTGGLTPYGKLEISKSMFCKGCAFVAAYYLLRQKDTSEPTEYAALHNLCQGIELILKSTLLFKDYNKFQPQFGKRNGYGHDLVKLSKDTAFAFSLHGLSAKSSDELSQLSKFYDSHRLRYGTGLDLFIAPNSIARSRTLRLTKRIIGLVQRTIIEKPILG